jgi:(p)ppGpp synthase/HD superfamily hydrolase
MKKGEYLDRMLLLATTAHAGQFDRGGKPYILHPLAVMQILNTSDEELMCIAIGHDIIEDTKTTYQDLRAAGMTERVIDGILALTKQPGFTYDEYKQQVFENHDAMLVKMADLTHNSDIRRLKGVTDKDIERMAKYHRFFLELKMRVEEEK